MLNTFSVNAFSFSQAILMRQPLLTNIWFYVDNQKATCYNESMRKFA